MSTETIEYAVLEPLEYKWTEEGYIVGEIIKRELAMNDKSMSLANMLFELGFKVEFIEHNHPQIDGPLLEQANRVLSLCAAYPAWRDALVKVLPTKITVTS